MDFISLSLKKTHNLLIMNIKKAVHVQVNDKSNIKYFSRDAFRK